MAAVAGPPSPPNPAVPLPAMVEIIWALTPDVLQAKAMQAAASKMDLKEVHFFILGIFFMNYEFKGF
jgi:hypothetical protein